MINKENYLKADYIYSIRRFKAMESGNSYSVAAQLELKMAMNTMCRSMSLALYGDGDDDQ